MSGKFIWCEIVCADCALTVAGQFTDGAIRRKRMAKEAQREGWTWAEDWHCRRHSPAPKSPIERFEDGAREGMEEKR